MAVAKDTVIVVGGLGTQSGKHTDNGGGATRAAWDAGSPSDFMDVGDGGAKSEEDHWGGSQTACVVDNHSGYNKVTISKAGYSFLGCTVGSIANVEFAGVYSDGRYEVLAILDSNVTVVIDLPYSSDTTCDIRVGGTLDTLQNALDKPINDAASYNRYIYDNITTETITATIDVDTYGGSSNTRVIVKAANSSCVVDGTRVIVTTDQNLGGGGLGLLSFTSASTYTQWWYVDFNAGGADKADYCIYNAADQTSSYYHVFHDCIFRGAADETGVWIESSNWTLFGCEVHNNGNGVWMDSTSGGAVGCSIHDNTGYGLKLSFYYIFISNCLVYDNGGNGIHGDSACDMACITGNLIFGNTGHGLSIDAGGDWNIVINNTSCGNGTGGSGYGYNFADRGNTLFFAYNHSCDGLGNANDNFDGHCNLMIDPTSDLEWDDFLEGNNQHGDPKFTSIIDDSEDFTPISGSPLIDNALDAEGYGELDIGAIQQAAGAGGGLLVHPGMSGGIRG